MDKEKVKRIVCRLLTSDTYYKKFRALKSDVDFFKMYMARNKKSEFRFDLRISYGGSFKAFDDIWKKYGYGNFDNDLEVAFAEFMLLQMIITDIYEKTNIFTDAEIKEFIDYFEQYEETLVENYVSDFIGCSHGCCAVLQKLEHIRSVK